MMLRILHVSDTQWPDGSEEKLIIDFIRQEKVDYLIHTGDLIDRKQRYPPAEAWKIIKRKLRILVDEGNVPLIIIPGNHDPDRFHRPDPADKRFAFHEVLEIFRASGANVPDGKVMSLGPDVTLSYLNTFSVNDYFYGMMVKQPIARAQGEGLKIAIAHGVGFVPYKLVLKSKLSWQKAIMLERGNAIRRLKEIIESGYDIILCGHHRHSNVPNGLFTYQGKLISIRGQHRTAERNIEPIASYGSLIEIDSQSIRVRTIDYAKGVIIENETIAELDNGK